ncbi:MAG: methyltransferase domain-containing protein [Dehalococcoidia bacterium]|nr:methyltransferase domain-containing protein [Dehalococcoidia bacterium]
MTEPVARHEHSERHAPAAGQWDPGRYNRFRDERSLPFYDLAAMVEPRAGMLVVDLGCGTGALTAWLHERLGARATLGIDSSPSMLASTAAHARPGLRFEQREIVAFAQAGGGFDLVFSNAALQWIDDHARLLPLVAGLVEAGGQIALQLPANGDHPSQSVARALAAEEPFASALGGRVRPDPVLVQSPQWYAGTLRELGFDPVRVEARAYPHQLPEPRAVVEWMEGTLLTVYRAALTPEHYAAFVDEYARRLLAALGERRPYLFTYKRILIWGRR